MRVTKIATSNTCAVCERTLLMGERAVSFAPSEGAELVDVCPLCQELASEAGWIKEGAPTTPTLEGGRRRRRKRNLVDFLGITRTSEEGALAQQEPILRIVPLSGTSGELAVTVAWELSWYQYRVSPESAQPVRLERRGHELHELEEGYKDWNAQVEDEGRLVPAIARI
jgi:hypothetical protein